LNLSLEDNIETIKKWCRPVLIDIFILPLRQMNANLRRKSLTFAKKMEYFDAKVALSVYFYNFIRPHSSLSKNQTIHERLEHRFSVQK
jgi:hypothetical protein